MCTLEIHPCYPSSDSEYSEHRMSIVGDPFKDMVGEYFCFTKISIPINEVGYKKSLGVVLSEMIIWRCS